MKKVNNEFNSQAQISLNENEQGRKLSLVIQQALEKERSRFSAELHDGLGQQLVAMKLYLESLAPSVKPDSQSIIETIFNLLEKAKKEMRSYSHNLSAKHLAAKGLSYALLETADDLNESERVRVKIDIAPGFPRMGQDQELSIFRMIQEQLCNSMKHGGASNIYIWLRTQKTGIEIEYSDDGVGFDSKKKTSCGNGLSNLKERANDLNGKFRVCSQVGKGYWSLLQIAGNYPFARVENHFAVSMAS